MSFIIDRASVHAGDAIKMGEKAVQHNTDVEVAVNKLTTALEGLQAYSQRHTHIGKFISWLCGDKKKEEKISDLINKLNAVKGLQPARREPDALKDALLAGARMEGQEFDPERGEVDLQFANMKANPSDAEIQAEIDRIGGPLPKNHPWYDLWRERFGKVLLQFRQKNTPPEQ